MARGKQRLYRQFVSLQHHTWDAIEDVKRGIWGDRVGFEQKVLSRAPRIVLRHRDRGPRSVGIGDP